MNSPMHDESMRYITVSFHTLPTDCRPLPQISNHSLLKQWFIENHFHGFPLKAPGFPRFHIVKESESVEMDSPSSPSFLLFFSLI